MNIKLVFAASALSLHPVRLAPSSAHRWCLSAFHPLSWTLKGLALSLLRMFWAFFLWFVGYRRLFHWFLPCPISDFVIIFMDIQSKAGIGRQTSLQSPISIPERFTCSLENLNAFIITVQNVFIIAAHLVDGVLDELHEWPTCDHLPLLHQPLDFFVFSAFGLRGLSEQWTCWEVNKICIGIFFRYDLALRSFTWARAAQNKNNNRSTSLFAHSNNYAVQ